MKIIVYTDSSSESIKEKFGTAEYSYYFVLREFLPVLHQCGEVITINDPITEVDPIYHQAKTAGEHCVFLSFMPPHKTYMYNECPTVPVLAWEFNDLPSEQWDSKPQHDWRLVLGKCGQAITHSSHSVATIRKAIRPDYPAMAIPSPVWDRFKTDDELPKNSGYQQPFILTLSGTVIDTHNTTLPQHALQKNIDSFVLDAGELTFEGVIYTSILNPLDQRKNWGDMITAFCWAFQDVPDATLILKLTSSHNLEWPDILETALKKTPTDRQCRIVAIRGYLEDDSYARLSYHSSYAVNSSKGEGQCLPLMEYMSSGTPAISPDHTGMKDYIHSKNSFVVAHSLEPSAWPDDTRRMYRTSRSLVNWESLRECYANSYQVAKYDADTYRQMSESAVNTLKSHCSQQNAKERLLRFFEFHLLTSEQALNL